MSPVFSIQMLTVCRWGVFDYLTLCYDGLLIFTRVGLAHSEGLNAECFEIWISNGSVLECSVVAIALAVVQTI